MRGCRGFSLVAGLCVALSSVSASADDFEILFVGDVSFAGRRLPPKSQITGTQSPFRDVVDRFATADLVVANGEGLLTDAPPAAYGESRLNIAASPRWAGTYHAAGVDLVGLANNHTWDGGAEGLLENRRHLEATGVAVYGAGATADAATAPYFVEKDGRCRVAVLPATLKSNRPARKGAFAAYYRGAKGLQRLAERIRGLVERGCFVIVSVHWGREGVHKPPRSVVRAAHHMVDAGAGLVVGHHPHVLQGVEYYRGTPIAYSLGNFVFTNRTPAKRETGLLSVRLTATGPVKLKRLALVPATIAIRGGFVPRLAEGSAARRTADHLRQWSASWGTTVVIRDGEIRFGPSE